MSTVVRFVEQPVYHLGVEVEVRRGAQQLVEGELAFKLLATVVRKPGFQTIWLGCDAFRIKRGL